MRVSWTSSPAAVLPAAMQAGPAQGDAGTPTVAPAPAGDVGVTAMVAPPAMAEASNSMVVDAACIAPTPRKGTVNVTVWADTDDGASIATTAVAARHQEGIVVLVNIE